MRSPEPAHAGWPDYRVVVACIILFLLLFPNQQINERLTDGKSGGVLNPSPLTTSVRFQEDIAIVGGDNHIPTSRLSPIPNAHCTSLLTSSSSSVSNASSNARFACSPPILPSAQATCPRTTVSYSCSAPISAGIECASPILLSATHTFLNSPRALV